ncbi:MAG: leucine-rich repeat domain-containing protein [Firmicutes bacterium]|nr:leucine-rich repeat domain-containing protein [Bacillota bacterium]
MNINGINREVIRINSGAFFGCAEIVSVTIPNSVKALGDRAFFGCSALKRTVPLRG